MTTAPEYANPTRLDALRSQWPGALEELEPDTVGVIRRAMDGFDPREGAAVEIADAPEVGWRVGVCVRDRPGALALVAGALTARGLDITNADTFTVRPVHPHPNLPPSRGKGFQRARSRRGYGQRRRSGRPVAPPPPTVAAMAFDVRAASGRAPDWADLVKGMESVGRRLADRDTEEARLRVAERVAQTVRDDGSTARALPMDIRFDGDCSPDHTLLEILSRDTPGFLFAFSNALSSVRVNVLRSRVRTVGDEVHDTFWLTEPSGGKLASERRARQVRAAAALIKQFTYLLPTAPDPEQALRQFNSLLSQLLARPDWNSEIRELRSPGVLETLAEMMGASRFMWEDFLRVQHENLFPALLDAPGLYSERSRDELSAEMEAEIAAPVSEHKGRESHEDRTRAVNEFKDREMFRISLRSITGRIDRRQFGAELSTLAEVVVEIAFVLSVEAVKERLGAPLRSDGAECGWAIFGLGKFGGAEMGFGSDLELMFVYEDEGMTRGGNGASPARTSTFFEEAVREFLRVIQARRDGIFEVDMRLRPYGSKGALAASERAVGGYYSTTGSAQQFERLALARMRPVAGDAELGRRVMRVRDAFVYSPEPPDVENIRHLRRRQAAELVERGAVNAKLSRGGLVDIEYRVQAWQIANGADDRSVRATNTLEALEALRSRGYVDDGLAAEIAEAYDFIRDLVDGLRVVRGNAKDLTVPPSDSREFKRLAHRLGVEPGELGGRIEGYMGVAAGLWE